MTHVEAYRCSGLVLKRDTGDSFKLVCATPSGAIGSLYLPFTSLTAASEFIERVCGLSNGDVNRTILIEATGFAVEVQYRVGIGYVFKVPGCAVLVEANVFRILETMLPELF